MPRVDKVAFCIDRMYHFVLVAWEVSIPSGLNATTVLRAAWNYKDICRSGKLKLDRRLGEGGDARACVRVCACVRACGCVRACVRE